MDDLEDENHALSDAELERALRQLKPIVPLTRDELEGLREVLAEWRYQQRRRSERKRNWPLITLLVSSLLTAAGWVASILLPRWLK